MKLQAKYGIRTLLAVTTLLAVMMIAGRRLRDDEIERQRLVSDEYTGNGMARFDSYAGHTRSIALPFARWIGNKLAASDSAKTQVILVDFHKPASVEEIKRILSLFPEVELVHFNHSVANPANIQLLSQLPNLKGIQVNDGRVDLATMKAIGQLRQCPEVTFQNIHLDDEFLADALSSGINLHYVYCPTSSITDVGLESVSKIRSLISLCIKDCKVSNNGLRALEGHPALRYVFLENCPVDDSCVTTLISIPNLYQLSLKGTKVSDDGMRLLYPIVASLRELDIRETALSQDTIDILSTKCKAGALKR